MNYNSLLRNIIQVLGQGLDWSKAIYAIERDLDEIALFYIAREDIGSLDYDSRSRDFRDDKTPLYKQNILITCIRKNKIDLFNAILNSKFNLTNLDATEYWIIWRYQPLNMQVRIKEKRILNILIEEYENCFDLVKTLIDYGISLDTPEIYCVEEIITPDWMPVPIYTRTPLSAAIQSKKYDIAKYLVERGANFNEILPEAILYGNLDLIEFFLLRGLSPYEGMQTAIYMNNKAAVILLLNFVADPLSFLDLAIQRGNQEIIDIIMNVIFNEN